MCEPTSWEILPCDADLLSSCSLCAATIGSVAGDKMGVAQIAELEWRGLSAGLHSLSSRGSMDGRGHDARSLAPVTCRRVCSVVGML